MSRQSGKRPSKTRRRIETVKQQSVANPQRTQTSLVELPQAISKQKELIIFLVDQHRSARRCAVVEAAIEEIRQHDTRRIWNDAIVRHYYPTDEQKLVSDLTSTIGSNKCAVILIVVTENELSTLSNGALPRKECQSISCGYELIRKVGPANDIYFVVSDVTGVDILSMLLSDARGVIDLEAIGSTLALSELAKATVEQDKRLNRIIIGSPYSRLDSLVDVWRRTLNVADKHWKLILALGELPLIKLPTVRPVTEQQTFVSDSRQSIQRKKKIQRQPTQKQMALEISKYVDVTGFVDSETHRELPDVLKMLAAAIRQMEQGEPAPYNPEPGEGRRRLAREEMLELPLLPTYVRHAGFPSRLLPIRDLNDTRLPDRLYAGLLRIETRSTSTQENIVIAQVTIPRNL